MLLARMSAELFDRKLLITLVEWERANQIVAKIIVSHRVKRLFA
jgi:hypothetical protein